MKKNKVFRKRISLITASSLVAITGVFSGSVTNAADCSKDFYSQNDILFYDACAVGCGATGTSSSSKVTELKGNSNITKMFNFFTDQGFSEEQSYGILASMWHEGKFNPTQHEFGKAWEIGGWGIAAFTAEMRGIAEQEVSKEVGEELFNQYYKKEYSIPESIFYDDNQMIENGFKAPNVPQDVNDKLLLAQLNLLSEFITTHHDMALDSPSTASSRYPSMIAAFPNIKKDNGSKNVWDYIKTLDSSDDAAIAWTYLFESPGDIVSTAKDRAASSNDKIPDLVKGNSSGSSSKSSSSCSSSSSGDGSLKEGGLSQEEGTKHMEEYKTSSDSITYLGGAGTGCSGGPLANCVSYSTYFINKYTTAKGFTDQPPGNGYQIVSNIIARNPDIEKGSEPRPYSVFSYSDSGGFGHTGVVLGVEGDQVLIGEASCGQGMDQVHAKYYSLEYTKKLNFEYAYMEDHLKNPLK